MIDIKTIEEVKKRLVKLYNPIEIYIFGSYAWGKPSDDSDLDLLIIVDKVKTDKYKELAEGHKVLIGLRLSKDILLYTKEEFEKDVLDKTTLGYKIKRKGKQIYAKS